MMNDRLLRCNRIATVRTYPGWGSSWSAEMATHKDIDRLDIEAYVARARAARSAATGELIFAGAAALRRGLSSLFAKLGGLFHSGAAAQH